MQGNASKETAETKAYTFADSAQYARSPSSMKFLREPLVHFILIGGLLFVLFAQAGKWTAGETAANRIVVSPGMIENLKASFRIQTGKSPNPPQLNDLITDYIHEEILCREARNLGIDRDDTIVRTILKERMEYIAEGTASIAEPSEAELQAFLAAHSHDFKKADGDLPALPEIHASVLSAWRTAQRKAAAQVAYEKLREHYRVTVEMPPPPKS